MTLLYWIGGLGAALLATVPVSLLVESLRTPPPEPDTLYWNPAIASRYATIKGTRIRFVRTGHGPNLVLLHTLRTQLDIFEKMVGELSQDFTVYALDYPGHGFSDIPGVDYVPDLFVDCVEGFLDSQHIDNVTLAGISIGGTIPLLIAARRDPRVLRVIAVNPYDYGRGRGVERGNLVARLIVTLARIPVIGETVMRLRQPFIERRVLEGGVAEPAALPKKFLDEVFRTGERKGHYRAFINLLRNAWHWEEAHAAYGRIRIPVLLIYGDRDWSTEDERRRTLQAIPDAKMQIVRQGGHFLSLDQPTALVKLIREFSLK